MRSMVHRAQRGLTLLAVLAVTGAGVPFAWAQTPGAPGSPPPPLPGAGSAPVASGESNWMAALVVILGLVAIVAVAVKMIDLRNKREAEALQLQAQVSDALLRDARLAGLAVVPTAHIPMLKGSPVTLEISGHVPSPEERDAALRIVKQEALRVRPDIQLEDRLEVMPSRALQRAA